MPNSWFRMYAEFADDPKVQMMPEHMQRRLVMLFCERCKDVTVSERHRAFSWRISDADLAETKALFIEAGFIDEDWNVLNWNKRQFISDSSTDRTRRYRERKRTSHDRHGDNDETKRDAPDTDTDTEADTENRGEEKRASAPPPRPVPVVMPHPASAGANGEFMAANWLGEELGIAFMRSELPVVAKVIQFEARIRGDTQAGAEFIRDEGLKAQAAGDRVDFFWIKDRKWNVQERDIYAAYLAKGE